MKKNNSAVMTVLLVMIFIAFILCGLSAFGIFSLPAAFPVMWALLTVCNIMISVTGFKNDSKKTGIIYLVISIITFALLIYNIFRIAA